jgi:hypothetical protein
VSYAVALNPAQFTVEAPSIDSSDHWTVRLGNGVNTVANADGPTAVLNTWTDLVETYDGTSPRAMPTLAAYDGAG